MKRYTNTRTAKPPRFDGELVDKNGKKWPYTDNSLNPAFKKLEQLAHELNQRPQGPGRRVWYCHPTKGWRSMAPTKDMREVEHETNTQTG